MRSYIAQTRAVPITSQYAPHPTLRELEIATDLLYPTSKEIIADADYEDVDDAVQYMRVLPVLQTPVKQLNCF